MNGEDVREEDEGNKAEDLAAKAAVIMADESLDDSDRIRALHALGYSRKQLVEEFSFTKSNVYRVLPVRPEDNGTGKAGNSLAEHKEGNGLFPATLKSTEVITPEGIIQYCLRDGSRDWQLRVEGMMLLRAAQKMNREDVEILKGQTGAYATMMKPLLDTMIEISREQDAAARRAMGSNEEIAEGAAVKVAQHITPELQAMKSKIGELSAPEPNPMTKMLNFIQMLPQLLQAGQQLMGSLNLKMPGLTPGQGSGQSLPGGQPPLQTQNWQPPPVEKHSINELGG